MILSLIDKFLTTEILSLRYAHPRVLGSRNVFPRVKGAGVANAALLRYRFRVGSFGSRLLQPLAVVIGTPRTLLAQMPPKPPGTDAVVEIPTGCPEK